MQTRLADIYKDTSYGKEAENILRACVHCGFCTATCPTYQLLGDELDSPRGRIYLIKQVLEGEQVTAKTRNHLDRCLTCRSCETTCPSGVNYGRLIDIGREVVEHKTRRSFIESSQRFALRKIIPYPRRFASLLKLGQFFKPVLPDVLKQKIPETQKNTIVAKTYATHPRKMLTLAGCVQPVVEPQTQTAAANVLDQLGIQLITADQAGCCGAVSHHLSASNESHQAIKKNIDAWWPYVEQGVEAIISSASGCAVMLKDYGNILANDMEYADKAKRVSELAKDISEVLQNENLPSTQMQGEITVAFHSPCTLQHGIKINGVVENILQQVGYKLTQVNDAHLCCGSAGTYSILQAELSQQLLSNKLDALQQQHPNFIATANIGCQMHLSTKANVPVKHWIELLEQALQKPC